MRSVPSGGSAGLRLRAGADKASRLVFDFLPANVRTGFRRKRAVLRGLGQLKRNQALLAQRLAELERVTGVYRAPDSEVADARFPPGVRSRVCTQAQLAEPWYGEWCAALGRPPRANRKFWEYAYVAHVLDSLGQLGPGRSGLGFGVGREPLVALFAGRGCRILATDIPDDAAEARAWSNTGQHGHGLDGLVFPELCDPSLFRDLVTTRPVDMRDVPPDLAGFDFCWSACSLEHLGSLEAGLTFIEQSMGTLRPGGIAVHTTEYNLASDGATVTSGHTVLYRRRDLECLVARLEACGHEVAALDLDPGHGVLDEYIDLPPYVEEPHLRLWYREFTTTSVALVVRAAAERA